MDETPLAKQVKQCTTACTSCGSALMFEPGTTSLKCQHCGTTNDIEVAETVVTEKDYHLYLAKEAAQHETTRVLTIKCDNCGADTTFDKNQTAGACAFCASPLLAEKATIHTIIKPQLLVPFGIKQTDAQVHFRKWIKSLWFAPNNLKQFARQETKLSGIYLPYWTYDTQVITDYVGQRGINYQDTETYTTTENGKRVTRTRTVTKTRWYPTAGEVQSNFDDVLIVASNSLNRAYIEQLEPWNLSQLVNYDEKFLSGFKAESYQIALENGFELAKQRMDGQIRAHVCAHIGGDRQRILSMDCDYRNITFKHILLPVYVTAYRYNNKSFQIMVNGSTGEVTGERPYSWIKITLAVLLGLLIVAAIMLFMMAQQAGA